MKDYIGKRSTHKNHMSMVDDSDRCHGSKRNKNKIR